MSAHRDRRMLEIDEPAPRSKCVTCLCFSWKLFTCVFSHITLITLVVTYCIAGASLFHYLEEANEKMIKQNVKYIRGNTTLEIWMDTQKQDYLKEEEWINRTKNILVDFERNITQQMKQFGWDGHEDELSTQWSFLGSLFYSIIVITTIGYGHIAPKTMEGKIATIFYSIIGIPLMLLCLSNIGDIMASSFRFLYWRVCCYICTRDQKKSQKRHQGQVMRRELIRQQQLALQDRQQQPRMPVKNSIRRSMKTSQRSADSGFDQRYDVGMNHAYSEMDCRYQNHPNCRYDEERERRRGFGSSLKTDRDMRDRVPPSPRDANREQQRYGTRGSYKGDRHTIDRERFSRHVEREPEIVDDEESIEEVAAGAHIARRDRMRDRERDINYGGSPQPCRQMRYSEDRQMESSARCYNRPNGPASRVQSLDRRMMRRENVVIDFEQEPPCKVPVYFNKYAMENERGGEPMRERESKEREFTSRPPSYRSQSMPRQGPRYGDRLMPPGGRGIVDDDHEMMEPQPTKGRKRERPALAPSPRIMSPMGFAINRQARHIASVMDENSMYGDDDEIDMSNSSIRPVPIWLCVFLVIGYILGGAYFFSKSEEWNFLDAAYFCFITLTTIGFGDFVPAQRNAGDNILQQQSIAVCSIYLLFGIALLAMSFNLVQEEVIAKVKKVAKSLGIIKPDEEEQNN